MEDGEARYEMRFEYAIAETLEDLAEVITEIINDGAIWQFHGQTFETPDGWWAQGLFRTPDPAANALLRAFTMPRDPTRVN